MRLATKCDGLAQLGLTQGFDDLARQDPRLDPYLLKDSNVPPNVTLDFSNPQALYALAAAHLLVDFGLCGWMLPALNAHLVPAVPSRFAYLFYIHTHLLGGKYRCKTANALDIGTGANCIYPLLGVSRFKWRYLATDVDKAATTVATANVAAVGLTPSNINILLSTNDDPLFPQHPDRELFEYSMCNPPFHTDTTSARPHPKRARTGSSQQYVTRGGELAFIERMLAESAAEAVRKRVRWFTVLVGRKADLAPLAASARVSGAVVRVHEIALGQTARWVLAWTFLPDGRWDSTYEIVEIVDVSSCRFTLRLNLTRHGGRNMESSALLDLLNAAALRWGASETHLQDHPASVDLTWRGSQCIASRATVVPSKDTTGRPGCFAVNVKLFECRDRADGLIIAEQFSAAIHQLVESGIAPQQSAR